MNQEEREAIQKLLEKIPENELSKAVGGLSPAAKKAFALSGIFGLGTAIGFGGTWGIQHLVAKNKEKTPDKETAVDSKSYDLNTDLIDGSAHLEKFKKWSEKYNAKPGKMTKAFWTDSAIRDYIGYGLNPNAIPSEIWRTYDKGHPGASDRAFGNWCDR